VGILDWRANVGIKELFLQNIQHTNRWNYYHMQWVKGCWNIMSMFQVT